MILGHRNGRLRRSITALTALTTAIGMCFLATTAPASAAPTREKLTPNNTASKKSAHPVRQVCPPAKTGQSRCFALARIDVKGRKGVQPNFTPAGYGPADLQSAYDLPSSVAGSGRTVAIVDAFDNPNAEADLSVYRAQFGLPACTTANGCFRKVNQTGNPSPLPPPDAGWAGEISLDLDMVSAACPRCSILLVEADTNFNTDLAAAMQTAVDLGAKYVSNSYGGPEDPSDVDSNSFYDHPGVVVTASTGDFGFGTQYPATAPGVTAVGGTSLVSDSSPRGWSESAWAGAGSGCSSVQAKPSFQTDTGCPNRTVADVSAVADPNTGVATYDTFQAPGWQVFGGTSASSPIIASTYAMAGDPGGGSDPASYPYAAPDQLNDVTTGDNGTCVPDYLCTAGPGFDGPTGLGTPNGVAAFREGPHGTIHGTVTDSATQAPIVGAQVVAGQNSTVTDTTGSYVMSVPVGTYSVVASAYGYTTVTHTGVAVADGATVTQDFALTAVPRVTLSGKVSDGSGHNWPLYAKITVAGTPGGPIYTNPFTGHYSIQLPRQHTYSLTVEPVPAGYKTRTVSATLKLVNATKNVKVTVESSCTAPGYQAVFTGLSEHFDDTTIPSSWTVKDNIGSGGVWVANDPGQRGNLTGGTGNFAIIDSDFLGVGADQDTELISPVVDLSSSASPIVGLNSDYKAFFNSVADIDYTVDGGTTWTNVWEGSTTDQQGPLEFSLPLAAHRSAVQVRFHYIGEFSFYWEVDDVFVGNKACLPTPGGLVEGLTKDGNTKLPLNGVKVAGVAVPTDSGVSAATPDDGALPDGYYWLFSTKTGKHHFTATKSHYATATKLVNVAANAVTRQNFTLAAGRIAVSPTALSGTATLGGAATTTATLTNTGTQPVHVRIGERDGGFQIAGRPAAKAYAKTRGAAVQRVKGHFSPLKLKPRTAKTAARHNSQPADAPWESIADFPTPISSNSASFFDGKLYSVGGFQGANDIASLYVYDPDTKAWTKLADMGETREAPSSAWINGKLYVAGGWAPNGDPLTTTEVYDPAADSWSTVADNPKAHAAAGAAVIDNQLYLVGGCDAAGCGSTDVEIYDPATDSWSSGADYPQQVSWESCGGIDGILYCAGGVNDNAETAAGFAYDGSAWTPIADIPSDDWGAAYAAANGQLLISGGIVAGNTAVTNQGWAYDPGTATWTSLPNANDALFRMGGACGFYRVGGNDPSATAQAKASVLPGFDSCGTVDVGWLSEDPVETDVAAGQSVDVTVTMDSADLAQPGTYKASLVFSTDSPYPVSPVQVTFTVNPPKTWAKISGVISGKACSGTVAPIPGATVQIDTWAASYTLITDRDGTYALWLDKRNNPLTLIVAKDGWQPQTKKVRVKPGSPLSANFTLLPAKPCK